MKRNPCLTCGACCAVFCVSFAEDEIDTFPGGAVPADLTEMRKPGQRIMRGTLGSHPRCEALEGRVGVKVSCRIYKNRPSTCRKFGIAWEGGQGNHQCDRARAMYGFSPFSPW
ncbi:MAG TPA: YkgJ family cysteine cluster protein [Desulfobacteraceae bacterium]|nr:YkgJ family cysteine cluster protein [Desulfobacteraceae bacterium]|tara:strand:- start:806 stop:1144 length:339 start_codon:yes stop_codon:yes gene_type:complete